MSQQAILRHEETVGGISKKQAINTSMLQVEDYVYTINTFFPEPPATSAVERLCEVLKPRVLRTLAKESAAVLPSWSKSHANTLREGGSK